MSQFTLRNITLSFGGAPLLDNITLSIEAGDRIGLIGRNGVGKSSFLKLIQGTIQADDGELEYAKHLKIATLQQALPQDFQGDIFTIVASGFGELGLLFCRYEQLLNTIEHDASEKNLTELQHLQTQLDHQSGWDIRPAVERILSKMALNPDSEVNDLSGGMIRRVLIAKALVTTPDMLLLDEPTNHLDIDAIDWLEKFLLNTQQTIILISHDRQLLQKIVTRIIEIDTGRLFSWQGHYQDFLTYRDDQLAAEATADRLFDKRLKEEERWIRQGIKARRTRNEGRVRALEEMRRTRQNRRTRPGQAKLNQQTIEKSGKIVFDVEHIHYEIDNHLIIKDFSTTILRGDKIGIIGPNGCGKSTLLKLLLGELTATSGTIQCGTKLDISYFDQRQAQLDETKSVLENVSEGNEFITINGQSTHALSYLKDFLFSPDRAHGPVSVLSGGERNRLLLARLFTHPCNLLILDEPTNDLDIETLELLEEHLLNYTGTLLIVSHDRTFLNNVVTSTIVFDDKGGINEYVGGYEDYLHQRQSLQTTTPSTKKSAARQKPDHTLNQAKRRELKTLTKQIEKLEATITTLQQSFADNHFYQQPHDSIVAKQQQLNELEQELAAHYRRWEELESE